MLHLSMINKTITLFNSDQNYKAFKAGEIIFEMGDSADFMYVVTEGFVEILKNDEVFDRTEVGDIVGEMALIDDSPRSATARAGSNCKLVPVDSDRFIKLIAATPYFALQVMAIMAERQRRRLDELQT